ncbi:GAF domain-containing protein [Arthrobacter sp. CAN_A2]|uniref:GAF domain-containing protein n=1 Tax=Arthrobacter sp. CAN_A2 TaxID=2787718 RepID=UPI0018EF5E1F
MTNSGTWAVGNRLEQDNTGTAPASKQGALPPRTQGRTTGVGTAAEQQRSRAVQRLGLIGSGDEERFDRLTRTAKAHFGVSSATIFLIADDQQYLKSFVGPLHRYLERNIAFCNVTIQQDEPLIIPDTLSDPRFKTNPSVVAAPFIRFYAGIPLRGPGGWFVGSFCILDQDARDFSRNDLQKLHALANEAEVELNTPWCHSVVATT